MKRTFFCAAAAAALTVSGAAAPAAAQKKSARTSSLAAIQLECFKGQGARYDASTKRWIMEGTQMDMPGKTDAVNRCVAEKTGKPATPFMRERQLNQ